MATQSPSHAPSDPFGTTFPTAWERWNYPFSSSAISSGIAVL
jgi:hypothetical protein